MASADSPAGFARVGASTAGALAKACRLAVRHPTSTIGTDHLLVSLAQRMGLWVTFRPHMRDLKQALSQQRYYDSESAVPAGQSVTDLDLEVDGALREIRWQVFESGFYGVAADSPKPRISLAVREALRRSLVNSGARGIRWSGSAYLLDAVFADRGNRAHRLLTHCHIEPELMLRAIDKCFARTPRSTSDPFADDPRHDQVIRLLDSFGILPPPDCSRPGRLMRRLLGAYCARRARATPMLTALELDADNQAARLDHPQVTTAHLLLTILNLDEQLATVQDRPPGALVEERTGGQILVAHGVTFQTARRHLARRPVIDLPVAASPFGPQARSHKWANEAVRAGMATRADGRTTGFSTRLLIAALADLNASAAQLIRGMNVDPSAVVADAQRRLSPP